LFFFFWTSWGGGKEKANKGEKKNLEGEGKAGLGPVCLPESCFLLESEFWKSEFWESELFFDVW
jgi:hypothetical protein